MDYNINININGLSKEIINELLPDLKELSYMYLDESFKGNKVAFCYKDINNNYMISYNYSICFYAASTIKILACLMVLEKALNKELDLDEKILITSKDLKQDTGIIKYQKEDTYYTLEDLVRLSIVESDNTAYLKLVEILGKDKIKEYGNSLGAEYTMIGRETDSFGIVNSKDMLIYFEAVKKFIAEDNIYSKRFKEWLSNPTVKFINDDSIDNLNYVRKYGSWDIAYHEAGYVEDKDPYYLIVLTQLNKFDYKEEFINETAKKINMLHKKINDMLIKH
ncbi:MAG: serine hydrolase [Bacilli bacterium]|nr:serine hydrolase [Bacilli bacterium]